MDLEGSWGDGPLVREPMATADHRLTAWNALKQNDHFPAHHTKLPFIGDAAVPCCWTPNPAEGHGASHVQMIGIKSPDAA